ncbi:uncharacterized protein LOC123511082 [Portunus trituberculatus]|uniref:uncharacterized protein LOC123511082 n=1 Tax=Portunus trituberculatus TaxID=210409 RepID=UPI001E1D0F45|nr:uncharacterized protein LOC123511082 [Portunus trituberculatus]
MKGRPNIAGSRLEATEFRAARTAIICYIQHIHFKEAIQVLKVGKFTKSSPLYHLEPALDGQGILRIGGRRLESDGGESPQGPTFRPGHTLASLRRHYWVVAGQPLVDRILRRCFLCCRVNSKSLTQRQGELPTERITAGKPPFSYTGVDCFGPFLVTCLRRTVKRFGCIFTCLSTRAVHIEVLSSLDADAFLNALVRFIARRGTPTKLFSDKGTNFQRANKDLQMAIRQWDAHAKLQETLRRREIEWIFQPPTASHMGGVWERQIRSIRKILSSIIGSQKIDDERLHTLFCEVEATLNSRPLTAAPSSALEPEALTPDHLLRVGSGTHLPIKDMSFEESFRRRWIHAQALADRFWKRWSAEYLHTLRMRQRQIAPSRNLQVGDLVLVMDPYLPRNQWRLGRITQTLPGVDGLVRRVRLRTSSGELLRPIVKLCLLGGIVSAPSATSCTV